MAEFQFDTSGQITRRDGQQFRLHDTYLFTVEWSDLSPFVQGYVAAMFEQGIAQFNVPLSPRVFCYAFSDVAPETLARIIEDCNRLLMAMCDVKDAGHAGRRMMEAGLTSQQGWCRIGATFWRTRQREGSFQKDGGPGPVARSLVILAWDFLPLTPYLGDDGKVYLRDNP